MTTRPLSGRRVLVTGHTGFKGSWLVLQLARLGAEICGFALEAPTSPSLFAAAGVAKICRSEIGDIRDRPRFAAVVESFKPEVVFHLAAQSLVRPSYHDPFETYSTNVMGLVSVFEVLRKASSLCCIVNVTSDKCYENREWVWGYRETDPMGGFDPYSSSKGCAELVTASWRRSFFAAAGVGLASARAGNVIGGGDWAVDRLLPDFVRAISTGRELVIRSPRATRPWQHVLEPISGYIQLAEEMLDGHEMAADGWNFGPQSESERDVEWMAKTVCDLWGDGAKMRIAADASLHEAKALSLDISKAAALLGWRPRWTVTTAIEKVATWHKRFRGGEDAYRLCQADMADYERALDPSYAKLDA